MAAHLGSFEVPGTDLRAMHICFLNMPIEYYSPISGGAVATVIMEYSRELLARGHDVTILTPVDEHESYGVGTVIPIRAANRDGLGFVQRRMSGLRRRLRKWDWPFYEHYVRSFQNALRSLPDPPDVVIVHNDLVSPAFVKQIIPNTPVVVWLHNEQYTHRSWVERSRVSVDRYVAVSDYIRQYAIQSLGVPPERAGVIVNGVDTRAFTPRDGFLEDSSPLKVLFVGRIDPNKGPDLAADAVTILQREGLRVELTVAGGLWFYRRGSEDSDPFFQLLKSKMQACHATYLGHVRRPEVPDLVRRHDVVCVLSRSQDPCPLVVLEAMASGCAVIASPRGGLPEVGGGAALLVDPDDIGAVVSALRALVGSPENLREWKRRSVARASTASWQSATDRLEEVLGMTRPS